MPVKRRELITRGREPEVTSILFTLVVTPDVPQARCFLRGLHPAALPPPPPRSQGRDGGRDAATVPLPGAEKGVVGGRG